MPIQRFLIILGFVLIALGLLLPVFAKFSVGRLPGDIVLGYGRLRIYLPLATSLLISVILTLVLWLVNR